MSYSLDIDPNAQDTIAILPSHARAALAEAFTVLELAPWSGRAADPDENPGGAVRNLPFADAGIITYLILEADRRVDVLLITWAN